jgi:hypothetical protein
METDTLKARDGDVLVVSYPEVTVPLTTKYASVKIGGLIYTRRLVAGEEVQAEYDSIYRFLKGMAQRDAHEKVRVWTQELAGKRSDESSKPTVPPKPQVVR